MTEQQWPNPFERFADSFRRAAENAPFDSIAMTLVTATPDGKPSGRIVLLKSFDERGFVFFGNYESRKGQHLEANPYAGLCLYWPWLREQVRIEGPVTKVTAEESDAYFGSRPRGSQVGGWASQQSRPLESREELIRRCNELETQYQGSVIPRPPHWGGWRLNPELMEFWYDGEFRLHDRFVYTRANTAAPWTITRLNP